jgi:hypothetical protein
MNNLDIIIYSAIIFISFLSFIVMTVREFNDMNKIREQTAKDAETPSAP